MRLFFVCLLLFFIVPASTLASDTTHVSLWTPESLGAFGGLGFSYSEIASKEAIEINLQGGIIHNHWLSTGLHVDIFYTLSPLSDKIYGNEANLTGIYGGLFVTPILYSHALVHVAVPLLAGYGSIGYELSGSDAANQLEASDQYWVFEPGLEIELNLLKFIRITIGGYYRHTSKIHLNYDTGGEAILPDRVLNNFMVGVKLRFGKF